MLVDLAGGYPEGDEPLMLLDLPLSLAADVATLPVTVPLFFAGPWRIIPPGHSPAVRLDVVDSGG